MFNKTRFPKAGTMMRGDSLEEDGGTNSKEALLHAIARESAGRTPGINRKLKVNKSLLNQKGEFSRVNDGHTGASLVLDDFGSKCSDINEDTGNIHLNICSLPVSTDGLTVNPNSLPTCTGSLPVSTVSQSVNKCEKYRNDKLRNYKTENSLTTCDRQTLNLTDGNKSASVNLQPSKHWEQNTKRNGRTDSETNIELPNRQSDNCKQQARDKPSMEEDNLQEKLPEPLVDEATVLKFEPLLNIIDKLADGQKVPPQISMQYEMLRFCTLRSYPKENKPFITRLAQAGFYYASNGDELVCYCCARRKRNWVQTDIPMDVHRQMNPNCKFLVRNNEVNVSVKTSQFLAERKNKSESESRTLDAKEGNQTNENRRDSVTTNKALVPSIKQSLEKVNCEGQTCSNVCSSHDKRRQEIKTIHQSPQPELTQNKDSLKSRDTSTSGISERTAASLSTLNGKQNSELQEKKDKRLLMPKFPKYTSKTVRLASFYDCKTLAVSPERLADAGLFYVGYGDCVRCFQCGLGLRDWTGDDDPWIEHARWSKNCSFIIDTKGRGFVETVQLAVQYSQHHGENGSHGSDGDSAAVANSNDDTDVLLHTDAAQSLLEMGYHPNIIRAAIRKVLQTHDRKEMTAAKLMEVIFEIEDNIDIGEKIAASNSRSEKMHVQTNNENSSNKKEGHNHSACEVDVKEPSAHQEMSLNLEIKKMKRENEMLKQQTLCSRCKKNDVCIVFLPCGHLITCEGCAPSVRYCSVVGCGKYIKGTVRTFMS